MNLQDVLNLISAVAQENGINKPYIVGGIPRDVVLDVLDSIHDVDITTGSKDIHRLADLVGKKLSVEPKTMKDGHKNIIYNGISLDFSSNFQYKDIDNILDTLGVKSTDLAKETYSRDFTINTLLLPLDFSEILDITGRGLDDLEGKLLRTPVDPSVAFINSPMRMLRVFYYSAKYGFSIAEEVKKAILQNMHLFDQIDRHYAGEKINEILRLRPDMLNDLIEMGVLHKVPMTKELSKLLIKTKRLTDVI